MTKRWIFQNRATRTSSPVVSFPRKGNFKEESATGQATSLSWENDLMMNTFKQVDVVMLWCWHVGCFRLCFLEIWKLFESSIWNLSLKPGSGSPAIWMLIFRFSTQIYSVLQFQKDRNQKAVQVLCALKKYTNYGQNMAKEQKEQGILEFSFRNISDWKDWTVPVSRMKLQLRRMQVRPLARWDCIVYWAV